MNRLMPLSPAEAFFRHRFQRLFDRINRDFGFPEVTSSRSFVPSTDIRETPEGLYLYLDLPGLKKEDVAIAVEDHSLTVSGERKREGGEEGWHCLERAAGAFSRDFTLPSNVDPEKVDASFADGVLTIKVPRAESSRLRTISIK